MRTLPSLRSERVLGKRILPPKRNNLDLYHLNFLMSQFKSGPVWILRGTYTMQIYVLMFLLYSAVYFSSSTPPYPQLGILREELDRKCVNLPVKAWTTFKHFCRKPYKLGVTWITMAFRAESHCLGYSGHKQKRMFLDVGVTYLWAFSNLICLPV